jgi:prevent-host-death family protein
MTSWKLHNAKARFSELLETAIRNGPQIVTRRGQEAAVLVPIGEWRRLQHTARPGLKELLLGPEPRFENLTPKRGVLSRGATREGLLKLKIKTIPAGAFKSKCLAVMDEVQAKRESVIITKHGKPVAKLVPVDSNADEFYDFMKGKGRAVGDVISPAFPTGDWELD